MKPYLYRDVIKKARKARLVCFVALLLGHTKSGGMNGPKKHALFHITGKYGLVQ